MGAANGVNDDAASEGEIDLADVIPTTTALESAGRQLQKCESLVHSSPSTMSIGINESTTPNCALPSDQLLAAFPRTTCFITADKRSNSSSVELEVMGHKNWAVARTTCSSIFNMVQYNRSMTETQVMKRINKKHSGIINLVRCRLSPSGP